MMYLPTRDSAHSVDRTLSDVIFQSLRDGRTVELVNGDSALMIEIDGISVAPIAAESFDYPLHSYDFNEDAYDLVTECLDRKRKRRFERRKKKLATENHASIEGSDSGKGTEDSS
ncbi:hypothetical protein C437_15351 [Haloarcula vallismortis ATCC 29715]|uniref:Uncharacterized protein n=1 Tax=Haloarcula vallismortis ATCC 29715 TaxID=662477 RepID=M0J0C7_HALVA|nr:hypothetical protein [Haloarcula vallismortis]EMA01808.1 hypothetical protein C437_15351 [Haloarcula vallismortis ATCC 29715]